MRLMLAFAAMLVAVTPTRAQRADPAQAPFDAAVAKAKEAMLGNPLAAAAIARDAEPLALRLTSERARTSALGTALWLQAEAFERTDDLIRARPLVDRAYAYLHADPSSTALMASLLLTRGSISAKQGRVAAALQDFQNAHRVFGTNHDARHQAIALISLAMLYVDAKDYDSAMRYLDEALETYKADPGLAFAIENTRGLVLQDQDRLAEASKAFKRAIQAARAVANRAGEPIYLRNLARNQLLMGDVEQAEVTIRLAAQRTPARDEGAVQIAALSAQAALQRDRVVEAGRLIDRAFAGVNVATTDTRFRYAHMTAVDAYRRLGHPERALAHLEALKRLDDEATRVATLTSSALMAARFDSANQDAKIQRLRDAERLRIARDALQAAHAERTVLLTAGGAAAVVLVLLAIALVVIRRSRDQVRAANADLAITNGALGKALAAKTEFLATTSHEIRTPLNGILGMTQVMLADAKLATSVRERLDVVHGAGLTMRALVDDILDVAKMETGNLGLECAPFDPAACVRDATVMWAEQARAQGLAFNVDTGDCPPFVEGDAARVRQIVFNLLSNALKFTERGSIGITALAHAAGLRLVVTDTGVGIAADKQDAVFESFRQADASTTRLFGGTGLGLSICRSLVSAMGGTIALASTPGQGTTFTVDLPLPVVGKPVAEEDQCVATMLIVDRNPITRAMFRSLFEAHVGAVAFASGVDEAVARLRAGGLERVLVDDATVRAGGDAPGFVRALVATGVPVALLWPVSAEAERAELIALGIDRLIAKPITGAALIRAICPPAGQTPAKGELVSQAA